MANNARIRNSTLTPQQAAFAETVARGVSLADAYRAHFNVQPRTKAETVHQCASRLAADRKVTARILELRDRTRTIADREFDVDIKRWLRQACRIAFSDFRRYYNADGKAKLPHELDDDAVAAVVGVIRDANGRVIDYKLERKTTPLELIGRHLRAFDAENGQSGESAIKELMAFIAERGKLKPVFEVELGASRLLKNPFASSATNARGALRIGA